MISKIIGSCYPFLRLTSQARLYSFSETSFRSDLSVDKQVLKLQTCNSIRDIMRFLSKNKGEMQSSDVHMLLEKVNYFKGSQLPWDNYTSINLKVKNLDVDNTDINTLAHVAGISTMLNQHQSFSFKVFLKIVQRVQKLLKEGQKITDQALLSFLELGCEITKYSYIEALHREIMSRLPELKYKNYIRYLQIVNKRKLPTKTQKQTFSMFITKFEAEIQKIEVRFAINCYKHLKNLNRKIYNYGDCVKLLQQKIKDAIDDLDEKQILSLVNFKSDNNIFQKMVYMKVVDSIDENGDVPFDSISIFRILHKLTQNESLKLLGPQKQAKIMKFIQKNIDKFTFINQLIKKNFFTRPQLIKLNQLVFEKQGSRFQRNPSFIYQMTSRGIFQSDNNKQFLETVRAENPVCALSQKYLSSALIVDKLYIKDHSNTQIQDLREYFIKTSQGFKQGQQTLRNALMLNKNKLIESFNKRFGNIYLKTLIENMIEKKQKLTTNFITYLLCANDYKSFSKIIKSKNNEVQFYLIKPILQKVANHPSSFIGTFEFINKALIDIQINKVNMKSIINYLCNWDIHLLLEPEQVKSFLKLARKVINEDGLMGSLADFLSYFSRSPCKLIKNNTQYSHLLQQIQLKQQQKVKSFEQKNDGSKDRNSISFVLALELMRSNCLSKFYASKILAKTTKEGILKTYCEIVGGNKINWDNIEITPDSLILVTKYHNFTEEQLTKLMPKVKEAIAKANETQLEDAIMNIEMKKNAKAFQIVNALTDAYSEKINANNRQSLKLQIVLSHLQHYNYKNNQYKSLLTKIMENFTKNIFYLPTSAFPLLLNECLSRGIQCKQFINKIISLYESKIHKGQANWHNVMDIIEAILAVDSTQSLKLFNFILRASHNQERIMNSFILVDPLDQRFAKQITKFLQNLGETQMNQGIYRYLVAKNPAFKQFQGKLKLTNYEKKYFVREKIIKFMKNNNISYEQSQKYGYQLLKVGKKYIGFTPRIFNLNAAKKISDYFATIFEIPNEQKQNILILFVNQRVNANFTNFILTNQIEQFKNHKETLLQALLQRAEKPLKQATTQNTESSPESSKENKKQKKAKKQPRQQKSNKQTKQKTQEEKKEQTQQKSAPKNQEQKK